MLEFPNIITPNNDGYNDKFVVKGLEHFLHVELVIYNRWGTKIYESSNYQNNWDGEGRSDGVYYYVLRTTVGQQAEYTGTITILQK
jgi:gliding motility-associated-like protein